MSMRRKRSSRPSPRSPRIVSLRPPSRNKTPAPARMANETSPLCGAPPIHWAAKTRAPSATANRGMNHFVLVICIEDRLHSAAEVAGEGEREGQRGGIALLLDRVDRLPRHLDGSGEFALREPFLCAEVAHAVSHSFLSRPWSRLRLCSAAQELPTPLSVRRFEGREPDNWKPAGRVHRSPALLPDCLHDRGDLDEDQDREESEHREWREPPQTGSISVHLGSSPVTVI